MGPVHRACTGLFFVMNERLDQAVAVRSGLTASFRLG